MSVGYDRFNVEGAREARVPVAVNGGANAIAVAEHAIMLMLATLKHVHELDAAVRQGNWRASASVRIYELYDSTVGIIGMGRIGQAVARRARAFGLQIHYHNRRPVAPVIAEELGATYWESLDQMLARMDIISVNCPHTPATYHLLSARRLKLIRKDAYIVNTARGEVTDEDTLIKLIEGGEIAGAGLDVYEHEPAVNPKLVRLARAGKVTLLPHMGSATIEGRVEMGEKVIINIRTFLDAHKPPDRVLPSML
jgi:glyoxylate reductase